MSNIAPRGLRGWGGRFSIITLAGLSMVSAALAAYLSMGSIGAGASHAGGMDAMSLDLDPSGNSATVLGTREDCAIITVNGVMDGDEDSIDAVDVDVTATNIPTTHRMIAFGGTIGYSEANLTIEAVNINLLLAANSPSSTFNASEPLPDENGDNYWINSAADSSSGQGEAGSGVLSRFTVRADSGASPGAYSVALTDALHIATDGNGYVADATVGGYIAIDAACPGVVEEADVSVVGVELSGPATAAPGETFNLSGEVTLHNGGPTSPVNTDLTATLTAPAGCTIAGAPTVSVQDLSLALSTNASVIGAPLSWQASCSQPGGPLFSLSTSAVVDEANTADPNQGNNSSSEDVNVQVLGVADIKLTSTNLVAPAQKTAGTAFKVLPSAVIHNNGPYGPVNVDGSFTLSVSAPCFVLVPPGARQVSQLSVPVSSATNAVPTDGWWVQCNTPGTYTATVSASFALNQENVSDPNTSNSSGSTQASTLIKVGACPAETEPVGVLQNPSPLLVSLILALAGAQTDVPAANRTPIECGFDAEIYDPVGARIDDCEAGVGVEVPCTVSMDVALSDPTGHPSSTPTVRLLPNSVYFFDPQFDIAGDLEIPNGSVAGSVRFGIRTDAGLTQFGTPCSIDAGFPESPAFEAGIAGNVQDTNFSYELDNPNMWPNDLNGERKKVEDAISQTEGLPPPVPPALRLHSRLVRELFAPNLGAKLIYNVLIWHVDDPATATAFGGEWVAVGFPGDAVNPDPPGAMGGNPDADDIVGAPLATCAPHSVGITLNGSAGGATYVACTEPGDAVVWDLLDPDAVNFGGDHGTRSHASTCSLDLDGDGLTTTEETYFGTTEGDTDSDDDGVQDGPDNCPATANPGQQNYDGDSQGDICDPDVDGDGAANAGDVCPNTAVGVAADAAGCSQAQVDADADNVCNPGAPSSGPEPGCAGTDLCPMTATGQSVDAAGCSQAQVDGDADGACNPGAVSGGPQPCVGTDNCPITANPGQENADNDSAGDVCDSDDDNDGVSDTSEIGCGSDPLLAGARPERTDGVFAGVDDDGDTQIDEPLPGGSGDFDCDGDGYIGSLESQIFGSGRDQDSCGLDSWPSEFVVAQVPNSTDRVTIADLVSFIAPVRRLDTSPNESGFSTRWDLIPGPGPFANHIAINDLTALIAGQSGYPPMFGGVRAFNGPTCSP